MQQDDQRSLARLHVVEANTAVENASPWVITSSSDAVSLIGRTLAHFFGTLMESFARCAYLSATDGSRSDPNLTRRQLLRSAGIGAAGLTFAGALGEIASGALPRRGPGPPKPPKWRSRPDLQIPALTVTHSEQGVATDPIFIAPYNAPRRPGGRGDRRQRAASRSGRTRSTGRSRPTSSVQSYRGSPVLTWWEGQHRIGHGVGEYVIADSSYRTVRRVQAAGGLRGDLHEFVITPRDTALLTSYVIRKADLRAVGGPRDGTIQDAIFQEIDLASGRSCSSGTASTTCR